MFNNSSSYEYYNYRNFDKKHFPPNDVANQPKRLIPTQEKYFKLENPNINLEKDIQLENPNLDKPIQDKPFTENVKDFQSKIMSFFSGPDEDTASIQSAPVVPVVPSPVTPPVVPLAAPVTALRGMPTSPTPPIPPVKQLGGGEFNMDMHSLMRKNRMLNSRVQELEKDLYLYRR